MSLVLNGSVGVTFPSTSVQGDASIGYGKHQLHTQMMVNNTNGMKQLCLGF